MKVMVDGIILIAIEVFLFIREMVYLSFPASQLSASPASALLRQYKHLSSQ